ncbi:MAG: hypothetical protein PVJ09_01460 [Candidatus Woesebacteria bacterium]|jgi:hypothetical protein
MPKKKKGKKIKAAVCTCNLTAKQLTVMFGLFLLVHSVIIYVASMWFKEAVILGTHVFSPIAALVNSMITFTLIVVAATPVIEFISEQLKIKLTCLHWSVLHFFINAGALWLVARFAEQLGMGISSWKVVVVLALVFDLAQALLMKLAINKCDCDK